MNYMTNKIIAKRAIINFPTTAEGTRFNFFADRIITAPTARPMAATNPKISPKKFPNLIES